MKLTKEELLVMDRHLEEQSQSGLTFTRYCAERGVNYNALMYHRDRRRRSESGVAGGGFVNLTTGERVDITLANGVRLSVPDSSLPRVLGILCGR
jgi:hypothetical protein